MAIGTKLNKVMDACRYMTKDGRNAFQNYDYTTAASIFGKINEAMTAQGLYLDTRFELIESRDVTTNKGGTEKFVVMKAIVTVHDAEDPKEFVTYEGYGSGQDAGDKACMKANTAALKYAYVGGLCISMGDDPEEDNGTTAYQSFNKPQRPANSPPPRQNPKPSGEPKCAGCGKTLTDRVADYSRQKFGKPLCMDCQKKG